MKNKVHNLAQYTFSKKDVLLLDTNIWLYLFPAPSSSTPGYVQNYSIGMKAMLEAGARLVLDVMILSEYLNRYCRIEWEALYKAKHPNFKKFRQSPDFSAIGEQAAAFAEKILSLCSRHDCPFSTANTSMILMDFKNGVYDFNDGVLSESCRLNGWKFVTNDKDFTSGGIEVLTANQKLIEACR